MKRIIFLQLFLVSISTLFAQETDSIIDIRDSQVYKVVKIGPQWWMQENLNIGTRIDGTQDAADNGVIEKYCYSDNPDNCETYGGLYQWDEMMDYNPSDNGNPGITQGVCPVGWHLPTDAEWKELEMFLGMSQSEADFVGERGTDEGGKLKETGTTQWYSPNTGATNESGFTAFPGGYRYGNGAFNSISSGANLWSSTEDYSFHAWYRGLLYHQSIVFRNSIFKDYGYSVRCLRDSSQFSYLTISDKNLTTISKLDFTVNHAIDTVVLFNSSAGSIINVSSINTRGSVFNLNQSSAVMSPGDSIHLAVIFNPPGVGHFTDSICIESDDPFNPVIYVPLSGYQHKIDSIIDVRDGQVYNVVKIGQDWWMQENLNIGTRIDGNLDATDNDTIEKQCYDDNPENCSIYGGLYQWDEVMDYNLPDYGLIGTTRGICPLGWHLPTQTELYRLVDSLGENSIAGGKLKEIGYSHWEEPNTGATNESGFTAFPGGYHYYTGDFNFLEKDAYFWSATSLGSPKLLQLFNDNTEAQILGYPKMDAYSVRCLRDPGPFSYLTVRDMDLLPVSELSFYFNEVTDTLCLFNTGAGKTITISSIYTREAAFELNRSSVVLAPGDSLHLVVTFNPPEKAIYRDTLFIESNDPYDSLITIPLIGTYPPEIIFTEIKNISCNGFADGSVSIEPILGIPPYTIKWFGSSAWQDSVFSNLSANVDVWVTVTDSRGWAVSDTVMLTEPEPLSILSDYSDIICLNSTDGFINCNPSGGTPSYDYTWSNGATSQMLTDLEAGDYDVKVTDSHGCEDSASLIIHNAVPYGEEKICVVTIDILTGKNMVIWEKTPDKGIQDYNIYREDELIGTVAYNDLSIFKDTVANPEIRPFLYYISVIDTCGNESAKSPYHKPLFLQYVSSVDGVNLRWSNYVIEGGELTFANYSIFRGSDSTSLSPFAEGIPTVVDVYTDNDPAALSRKYFYRVAGILSEPCYPSDSRKAGSGPYHHSLSNMDDNKLMDPGDTTGTFVYPLALQDMLIFPNPFSDYTTIVFPNNEQAEYRMILYDMMGKIVWMKEGIREDRIRIQRSQLRPGYYHVELVGQRLFRGTLVVK